jgi:hypothetical protein
VIGALEAMLVVTAATRVALLGAALFERHSARVPEHGAR